MTYPIRVGDTVRRDARAYEGMIGRARYMAEEGVVLEIRESKLFRLRLARVQWPSRIVTECGLDMLVLVAKGRAA